MNKIDPTKPMRLTDGTPVDYVEQHADGDLTVSIPTRPYSEGYTERVFSATGCHVFGELPDLENVPEEPKFKVGDRVTAGDAYGGAWQDCTVTEVKPCSIYAGAIGVSAENSGGSTGLFRENALQLIDLKVSVGDRMVTSTGLKATVCSISGRNIGEFFVDYDDTQDHGNGWKADGSKKFPKAYEGRSPISATTTIRHMTQAELDAEAAPAEPVLTSSWQNVYTDDIGETKHETFENAIDRSAYGHTRVGVMERSYEDGKLVGVKVHPTVPKLRSASNPSGINPFAC